MNVFDIIGPIMIGPSSSHTAGAVRLGITARMALKGEPKKAEILLHGSFAKTYKGHGTDKAMIAGIMGFTPDDSRIKNSIELAKKDGLEFLFILGEIDGAHPNTARIVLTDKSGNEVSLQGSSIGGGNIFINKINDVVVDITGQNTTIIVTHKDKPGMVSDVTRILANKGANIGNFSLKRNQKGGIAVMTIEIDADIDDSVNEIIGEISGVIESTIIRIG